ncbi:MAG: 2-oxoacid:acceptor oxidoreductase family protein [Oscillospiraceae bacterium]|nr:2-oxoacid:acceptor oxidoreductase family protein [Oscillospiraceae bacterium]
MYKLILAGYGGQGMLLAGQMLAFAAMTDGMNVIWLPSYGPEMRGGAASCSVVISEKPVGSPVVQNACLVAAMSQPALDKYHGSVAPGGILLYNSALVTVAEKRDGIQYAGIDFSELTHQLGNPKVYNMIVLGALNELLQCVSIPALHAALEDKFGGKKAELIALNEMAIEAGVAAAKKFS